MYCPIRIPDQWMTCLYFRQRKWYFLTLCVNCLFYKFSLHVCYSWKEYIVITPQIIFLRTWYYRTINAVILFSFRFFLNFLKKLSFILLLTFAGGRENLGKRSMLETNMFAKIILLFRNKNNILFFRCFPCWSFNYSIGGSNLLCFSCSYTGPRKW